MIKKVFVVGGGLMGSGIAQVFAQAGYEVSLNDVSDEILERSKANITKMLQKAVSKGKSTQEKMDATLSCLTFTSNLADCADTDLVVEAIIEKPEAKKDLFLKVSGYVREDAILASNTSSISIAEIASVVANPSRFMGTHFFSPVPIMKLLELVQGIGTSQETVDTMLEVGKSIGKVCIVSKDRPAFIVNRMLDPMINEAISIVEAGTGSIEDVDNGMKYGCNHPMGPLELIDMAGIDIELAVMEVLYAQTGDPKYRPSGLLRDMVRMGWLGRKTGKGFYLYHEDGSKTPNSALL